VNNPTAEEIEEFCDILKQSLLEARTRGTEIRFSRKDFHKENFAPEKDYGATPVDLVDTGVRLVVEIGEPAREGRLRDEVDRRSLEDRLRR
jgi:hypothetical protein